MQKTYLQSWIFLRWGQRERYELAEEFLDIGQQLYLDEEFTALAKDLPSRHKLLLMHQLQLLLTPVDTFCVSPSRIAMPAKLIS